MSPTIDRITLLQMYQMADSQCGNHFPFALSSLKDAIPVQACYLAYPAKCRYEAQMWEQTSFCKKNL